MRVLGAVNARPQAQAATPNLESLNPSANATTIAAALPAGNATGDQHQPQAQAAADVASSGVCAQLSPAGADQLTVPADGSAVQQQPQCQGSRPQAEAAIGWRVTLPFEGPASPPQVLSVHFHLLCPYHGLKHVPHTLTCPVHQAAGMQLQQAVYSVHNAGVESVGLLHIAVLV